MEDLKRDDICDWVTEDKVWWEAELVGSESMGTECSNCKTLRFLPGTVRTTGGVARDGSPDVLVMFGMMQSAA